MSDLFFGGGEVYVWFHFYPFHFFFFFKKKNLPLDTSESFGSDKIPDPKALLSSDSIFLLNSGAVGVSDKELAGLP